MPKLMLLPANKFSDIRLLQIPDDFEEHEVYRHVTALISELQEHNADCTWEDVEDRLLEHGFIVVDYILGPELKCHSE